MLLSEILFELSIVASYKIEQEKHFETLGLVESDVDIAYCTFLEDIKYLNVLKNNAVMIFTTAAIASEIISKGKGVCIVDNPRETFFLLHNQLRTNKKYIRKNQTTKIGKNCLINPLAVISEQNIIIGDNVIIEEFVVIREYTVIGNNTIIRAGAKIGGQGFEFKRKNNTILAVEHLGGVVIGDNVEIQYNTCVDKAVYPWDNTYIGDNTKIDNLVHVAHAVKIDNNVLITALSGIGGRTIIKKDTWVGFGAIIKNGIIIGESARTNMGAVVSKNVDDGESVTGNFAIPHDKFIEQLKRNCNEG